MKNQRKNIDWKWRNKIDSTQAKIIVNQIWFKLMHGSSYQGI